MNENLLSVGGCLYVAHGLIAFRVGRVDQHGDAFR